MDDSKIDELMRKPYKEWIEFNIKEKSSEDLEKEFIGISVDLPDDINNSMPEFMDTVLKHFLGNKELWETLSMDVAGAMFVLAKEKIPSVSNYDGKDLEFVIGIIFEIVTLFLSTCAAKSQEVREIIGIEFELSSR